MTTLTIAIPTYNRLQWLKQSLPSVLDQAASISGNEIEVVVSDNASTDGTNECLQHLEGRFDFMRVHRNVENIGAEANFYLLPQLARGRYLFMLGDDDILKPGALQRILDSLQSEPDYVVVNWSIYDEDLKSCLRPRFIPEETDLTFENAQTCMEHVPHFAMGFISGWVGKREFFNQISEETYKHFARWGMSLMADRYVGVARFPSGRLLSEPLFKARQRGANDEAVEHFEYFDWFFRGGAEVLQYAVDHAGLSQSLARHRRGQLLLGAAWKRILLERSKGTFDARRTYRLLRKDYGDNWVFWVLCVPAICAPGLGNISHFAFGVRNALFRQT